MAVEKERIVDKIKIIVVALNCILAAVTLISLYTIATGAVEVDIPDENDFAMAIDTKTREAKFIANFTVTNHGLYDITDVDIQAVVSTEKGNVLIEYNDKDLAIPSGHARKFDIVAVLPFEKIDVEEWKGLMRNDSVFYLDVDIRANYLWGLASFNVDETLEFPWVAPINETGGAFDEYYMELLNFIIAGEEYIDIFLEKLDEMKMELDEYVAELLAHIIIKGEDLDAFADLISEIDSNIDNHYVDLLALVLAGEENVDVFVDAVKEIFVEGGILSDFSWEDLSVQFELWPLGENTSRIISKLNLELYEDSRTLTFDLRMILIKEVDGYNITMESFGINYA